MPLILWRIHTSLCLSRALKMSVCAVNVCIKTCTFWKTFEIEEKASKVLHLEHSFYMVLKLGRFGQQIRNTWKVLKCGAREGWKRSVGLIMWEMKKYYLESRSRGISYMKYVNGKRTELVTFCVETAFFNGLLKER